MRCISWIAVSSQPQTEKESPEEQRTANVAVVETLGGALVAELEVPGQSREIISFERACEQIPAYAQLREIIDRRGADLLICRDLSRLGRTQALIAQVVAHCQAAGIAIYPRNAPPVSLDASEQADSDANSLLLAINASFAEIEIANLRRRWQYGMAGRVRGGHFLTHVPFGWTAVRDARGRTVEYHIDEEAASVIRTALLDLYLHRGMSQTAVADEMRAQGRRSPRGEWTPGVVNAFLRLTQRYAGWVEVNLRSGRMRERGLFPAFLTDAEASAIEEEQARRVGGRRSWRRYLFSLAVICDTCGHNAAAFSDLTYTYLHYYRCRRCKSTVPERDLIAELGRAVAFAVDADNHADILAQTPDISARVCADIAATEQQIADIVKQRKRLTLAYTKETIADDEYHALMAEFAARRSTLESRLETLQRTLDDAANQATRSARIEGLVDHGAMMVAAIQPKMDQVAVQSVNAWVRAHFRFYTAGSRIVRVEFV